MASRVRNSFNIKTLKADLARAFDIDSAGWNASVQYIEHHRSHLASAFFVSPYEESALLSIDGMGDFTSTMRAVGRNNRINVLDSVSYPHSLGIFYTAFTQLLGFPNYGDEYKVMGLAPYGKPVFADKLRAVVRLKSNGLFDLNGRYFRHFQEGVKMTWDGGAPAIGPLYTNVLTQQFGPARSREEPLNEDHYNLAASVQAVCEEVIFHMANDLKKRSGMSDICLSGGVAQNSVANGKVTQNTDFQNLFVPPAGHDAGTSVGAALYFHHQMLGKPRSPFRHQAYTGAQFSNTYIFRS